VKIRMLHQHTARFLLTAGVSLALLGVAGCEGSGTNASANVKSASQAELFTIPPEQMTHVQVVKVQPMTVTRTLRLTGSVAFNAFHTTPVISQVSGPVNRIVVVPGQHIKQGDPMLFVASPDYSQLRTNYLKAKDAYALAQKALTRAQDLYQHKALSEQALEQAQSTATQAGGDLASAAAALKILGISDPDTLVASPPTFEVPVKAPIKGEVVEQDVAAGQLLQTGVTQCFLLSDTSTVWVLVNVYQKDFPYIRTGDAVTIQTDAYPDVFHGKIAYVAPSLDPNTRTLQARIETINPGEKLKKDMYVVATVNAGKIQNAIVLPDAAILRDNENQPFVYAENSANQFGRRPVTLGQSSNGQTEVAGGIKAGDQVIGNGSLFLQFANSLQR
jgi:membrane fusion protein, heavy metal efflux system